MGVLGGCRGEGFFEAEGCFLVFVDVDGEGLVSEAFPVRGGGLVEALAVDQEP